MAVKTDNSATWIVILNLIESHLVYTQNFTHIHRHSPYLNHPILTAVPPPTAITPHPTELPFLILQADERVSSKLFAGAFDWMEENVLHFDVETGGFVKDKWETIVLGVVATDSTITYYKVHDGIRKPLEGTAGV